MTSLWLIFFSLVLAFPAAAATVAGRVALAAKGKDHAGGVVWLEPATPLPPVARRATMTQKNKTFSPHVLAISTGTTVDFPNLDPVFHNAFSSFDGKVFDIGLYAPGSSRSVRFDRGGIVRVFCNIHATMSAIIVVVDTPWFAATARDGSFEIQNAPPGSYTLHVYHERATPKDLAGLTRPLSIDRERIEIPPIVLPESSWLPAPHKNKFGKDYPPERGYPARNP